MILRSILNNALWTMLASVFGRGSLIVSSIILSWGLTESDYVVYNYFQLTVSMLAAYAGVGIGISSSRFFAEINSSKSENPPVGTLWVISFLLGGGVSLVLLLIPVSFFPDGFESYIYMLAIGVFVVAINVVPSGGILGLELYRKITFLAFISAFILVIGVFFASNISMVLLAMAAYIVSSFLNMMGNSYYVIRRVGKKKIRNSLIIDKASFAKISDYIGYMALVSIFSSSGIWVVGNIILENDVGGNNFSLYVIGMQWFSLALFLPGMVSRVILPKIIKSKISSSGGKTETVKIARAGILITFLCAVCVSVAGLLISPWVKGLYGSASIGISDYLIACFLFAAIPIAPANTLGNIIVADNGQRSWFFLTIFGFSILIVVGYFFSYLGPLSAALAQALSGGFLTCSAIYVARKRGLV